MTIKKAQEEAKKAQSEATKTKTESQDAQNKAVNKDDIPSQKEKPHTSAKST